MGVFSVYLAGGIRNRLKYRNKQMEVNLWILSLMFMRFL